MRNDNLGDRMKGYENISRIYLTKRLPAIIRIDGKSFHTFTGGFKKPFDEVLVKTMQETMQYLCENIEGCVLGYTQSDEITLVLCDYQKLDTSPWFEKNLQKMCSVSAAMATLAFNKFFSYNVQDYGYGCRRGTLGDEVDKGREEDYERYKNVYFKRIDTALFDSRAFTIPKEEVNNCLLWRQQDASRNSIQMVAQANFSHKQLQGKNCNELQELLWAEKGINWNDTPTHLKRGSCCIKEKFESETPDGGTCIRNRWVVDTEIPIFSQNPDYVNSRIVFD